MLKHLFSYGSLLVFLTFMSLGCSEDTENNLIIEEGTQMTSFSFLAAKNKPLSTDIHLDINGDRITGIVPIEGSIDNLIASFEHEGSDVLIGNETQKSGITYNDFRKNHTYTVKTSDGQSKDYSVDVTYYTGLPIIYLDTDGVPIDSKEEYREGSVKVFGTNDYENLADSEMKIRGRGNSTWYFHEKKAFQMKFSDKTSILGMPEDKKWIFLAEHSDKTLLRNKIAFEMGYMSRLDWTPESHFAEVFINDAYNGTYNISQKVEESDHRVVLGDTGYLLEIDQLERMESDDVYFYTDNFLINIKEPEVTWNSVEHNYAKNLLNEFETVLFSENYQDPANGYQKYIDLDSFIDWYLISEITKNQDSKSWSSIFLHVIPGEKIKMGPLWDFDLAFGNVNYSECEYPEGFWVKDHKWYQRLFQDPNFVALVKTRFEYFKSNESVILEKIDSYANHLKMAHTENDLRWDTIGIPVWPNPVVFQSYEEEVEHLKNWYSQRMNWLNTAINEL